MNLRDFEVGGIVPPEELIRYSKVRPYAAVLLLCTDEKGVEHENGTRLVSYLREQESTLRRLLLWAKEWKPRSPQRRAFLLRLGAFLADLRYLESSGFMHRISPRDSRYDKKTAKEWEEYFLEELPPRHR